MNGFGHLHSTQSRYFVFLTTVRCRFHLWKQTSSCSQFFPSVALRIYPCLTLPLTTAAYIPFIFSNRQNYSVLPYLLKKLNLFGLHWVFLALGWWVYWGFEPCYIHKIFLNLLATACICSIDISILILHTAPQQLSGRLFQLEHSLEILFSLEELCNVYTESYLPSADPTT